jgi:hypothetical protein
VSLATVAEFRPPDAVGQLEDWRRRHADALARVPERELVIDVGRAAEGGDLARVRVEERYVELFNA